MDFTDFNTGKDDEGRRLDKVIRIIIPQIALSNIYQSVRKGLIKVNGKKSKPEYKICSGDILSVADILLKGCGASGNSGAETSVNAAPKPPRTDFAYKIENLIVYESPDLLVLNKPSGINVHKAKKDDISLDELVLDYYSRTHNKTSVSFKPGPLHRLDKMTSGLVCFSMSLQGAKWFSEQMHNHKIKKTYSATVEGTVTERQTWKDYILKEDEEGNDFHTVKVIPGQSPDVPAEAKECITTIIPVEQFTKNGNSYTKVHFLIETGRQHQIRAQSSFHKHPLAGDTAYSASLKDLPFDLCAFRLEFEDNLTCEIPSLVL